MLLDEGLNFCVRVPWRGDLPLIADNPRAVSRAAVQTLVRVARFSAKWITCGLPVIQEERLTNLNEPSLNSYLDC
jgi:hypothetical protein